MRGGTTLESSVDSSWEKLMDENELGLSSSSGGDSSQLEAMCGLEASDGVSSGGELEGSRNRGEEGVEMLEGGGEYDC